MSCRQISFQNETALLIQNTSRAVLIIAAKIIFPLRFPDSELQLGSSPVGNRPAPDRFPYRFIPPGKFRYRNRITKPLGTQGFDVRGTR